MTTTAVRGPNDSRQLYRYTTVDMVAARLRTTSPVAAAAVPHTPAVRRRRVHSVKPRRSRRRGAALTAAASASSDSPPTSQMVFEYTQLELDTKLGISLHDITPQINACIAKAGVKNGYVNVLSRHTTTGVTINEAEPRLMDDVRQFLRKLAPPDHPYLHNDLHLREEPDGWPGGWEAWAAQEPENCHSHLLSMLLGNSETVPVVNGELTLGGENWESRPVRRLFFFVFFVSASSNSIIVPPSQPSREVVSSTFFFS